MARTGIGEEVTFRLCHNLGLEYCTIAQWLNYMKLNYRNKLLITRMGKQWLSEFVTIWRGHPPFGPDTHFGMRSYFSSSSALPNYCHHQFQLQIDAKDTGFSAPSFKDDDFFDFDVDNFYKMVPPVSKTKNPPECWLAPDQQKLRDRATSGHR